MECTDLMLDDWVIDTYTGKPMRVPCVNIKVGKGLALEALEGMYKNE